MRNLQTVKPDELAKAALDALEAQEGQWSAFWRLPDVTAAQLGGSMHNAESLGITRSWGSIQGEMNNWVERVRRALNRLADERAIVRVRRGEQLPWGGEAPEAYYFTLAAAGQAKAEAEAKNDAEVVEAAVWRQIRDRLAAGPGVQLAPSGTLRQDDWLDLLEKAGW